MGASISIDAKSMDEFMALESEGAPSMHITYGSTSKLMMLFGMEFDSEYCCGYIDPQQVLDVAQQARERAALDLYDSEVLSHRVELMIEMAQMARRLDRQISYA